MLHHQAVLSAAPMVPQGANMVPRLRKCKHQAYHLTILDTSEITVVQNKGLKTNIQQPASQHTPRHLGKKNSNLESPTSQQPIGWRNGLSLKILKRLSGILFSKNPKSQQPEVLKTHEPAKCSVLVLSNLVSLQYGINIVNKT